MSFQKQLQENASKSSREMLVQANDIAKELFSKHKDDIRSYLIAQSLEGQEKIVIEELIYFIPEILYKSSYMRKLVSTSLAIEIAMAFDLSIQTTDEGTYISWEGEM